MYARYIMAAILKFKMADKPTNTRLNRWQHYILGITNVGKATM